MIPVHEDKNLTDEYMSSKGYTIGKNLFYNAMRDGSGRYNGYGVLKENGEITVVKSVQDVDKL